MRIRNNTKAIPGDGLSLFCGQVLDLYRCNHVVDPVEPAIKRAICVMIELYHLIDPSVPIEHVFLQGASALMI
ncbi:hypothetical protein A2389_02540 [Candidatus Adlerbacteria bacterium RIFOXYB1_FULL_48_10]|nr:MAG: hypothetical protein A2389_02540 [Candidatus Adlerbacteria bacterium RIFOXYB1_FULL_48_10]